MFSILRGKMTPMMKIPMKGETILMFVVYMHLEIHHVLPMNLIDPILLVGLMKVFHRILFFLFQEKLLVMVQVKVLGKVLVMVLVMVREMQQGMEQEQEMVKVMEKVMEVILEQVLVEEHEERMVQLEVVVGLGLTILSLLVVNEVLTILKMNRMLVLVEVSCILMMNVLPRSLMEELLGSHLSLPSCYLI